MSAASFSLSLPSDGWKSTSMPRSLKICTAEGESASEMRTLGMRVLGRLRQRGLGLGKCPIEPGRQRLDVARLHRRPAPDAQTGRRVAVIGDVVGHALLLQEAGKRLGEGALRLERKPRHRRIED